MNYFDTPAFAHDLKIVLKSRHLAQIDMAAETNVSPSTITRLFKSSQTPTPDHLACLLAWSGLSFDDYVREKPQHIDEMLANGAAPLLG